MAAAAPVQYSPRFGLRLPVFAVFHAFTRNNFCFHICFFAAELLDRGGFGDVYRARLMPDGRLVAIKQVNATRYKNSWNELTFLLNLEHVNIIRFLAYFHWIVPWSPHRPDQGTTNQEQGDLHYLHFVMEYGGTTLLRLIQRAGRNNNTLDFLTVKVYTHQLLRGLLYLHGNGIVHQDIKPNNLLIDERTHRLTICDLGAARVIIPGETCSKWVTTPMYRAPELCMRMSNSTFTVDMWAAGCVLLDMLMGKTVFHPKKKDASGQEVLDMIMNLLGAMTAGDVTDFESDEAVYQTCQRIPIELEFMLMKLFVPGELIDLVCKMLVMNPAKRLVCVDALRHRFGDALMVPYLHMPDGKEAPLLFDFSPLEAHWLTNPKAIRRTHCFRHTHSTRDKVRRQNTRRSMQRENAPSC